jgi:hypothetical protein
MKIFHIGDGVYLRTNADLSRTGLVAAFPRGEGPPR